MLLWNARSQIVPPFNETVLQVFARVSAFRDSLDGPQVPPPSPAAGRADCIPSARAPCCTSAVKSALMCVWIDSHLRLWNACCDVAARHATPVITHAGGSSWYRPREVHALRVQAEPWVLLGRCCTRCCRRACVLRVSGAIITF